MKLDESLLLREEKAIFALRSLYDRHGYSQYRMSKFEEYDLYVRNKDFLISDQVITFTDRTGRLMAMRPDVTLSIIRSGRDGAPMQKVYYNENVYRATGSEGDFRQIMQVGLECIGEVDGFCVCEVLSLAAQSLRTLSDRAVLNVSHLGVLDALMTGAGLTGDRREKAMALLAEKNLHELGALCEEAGAKEEYVQALQTVCKMHGRPDELLSPLRKALSGLVDEAPLAELSRAVEALLDTDCAQVLNLDFSVACSMKYYNGIVFAGFVEGVPAPILSGGQYDRLMRRLGRASRAIGFAVYLDLLELMGEESKPYDVDTVLLYDEACDCGAVLRAAKALSESGESVRALRSLPEKLRVRRVLRYREGEVSVIHEDA